MVLLLICFELSGDKYEEINKGKKVTKDNIERKKVCKDVQVIHKQITGTKKNKRMRNKKKTVEEEKQVKMKNSGCIIACLHNEETVILHSELIAVCGFYPANYV